MVDGTRMLVNTASWIEWKLFFFGDYDPETVAVLKHCLRPGHTMIDVGANIGTHALPLARVGRVLAFEPSPSIFARLIANAALNDATSFEARQVALGDRVGTIDLFLPVDAANAGGATAIQTTSGRYISVPCTTLDAIAATEDLGTVDAIKIDVEGYESAVIDGARLILTRQRPILIFEYNAHQWALAGQTFTAVRQRLVALGYTAFLEVTHRGLEPIPDQPTALANILAR